MTCKAFYQSIHKIGCTGYGESCEVCEPIPHSGLIALGVVIVALLILILAIYLTKIPKQPIQENK
jgi:hypothetical protein